MNHVFKTILTSVVSAFFLNGIATTAAEARATSAPRLKIHIDISSQTMSVRNDSGSVAYWPVSTGKAGARTPTGSWRINRMAHNHMSTQFKVRLPYAMFFVGGVAIHATTKQIHMLGKPVSNGCVRLAPANAARLYSMVGRTGASNTLVTVSY
jgi:lipoprotein-anchoring transpeptidase ErfK/SrfK